MLRLCIHGSIWGFEAWYASKPQILPRLHTGSCRRGQISGVQAPLGLGPPKFAREIASRRTPYPVLVQTADDERGKGFLQAFGAYGLWGVLVLYFAMLDPSSPIEIIGWRILFSIAVALVLLAVQRRLGSLWRLITQPRIAGTFAVAGALIAGNWLTFVFTVSSGNALEATLGYFINPLVAVILGMVFLGERLRPVQWLAVGIAVVAVIVLTIELGRLPLAGLILALSFGLYGLVKKRVSGRVPVLEGFTIETLLISPIALVCLAWAALAGGGITFGQVSALHTTLLALAGVVTSVPLLLYGSAAKHLSLVELGLMQYLAPSIMFVMSVLVLGEAMPPERWIGFGLVWLALVFFTADALHTGAKGRRAKRLTKIDVTALD